ncbi:FGGY-family carbohydrate kinase [Maribacter ulvicola]|uniref:Sugar (Pentulose or hexulose) kinase n=1 Tax=Maribacter ulvicola TaxID=228959 RepID=A0A1N6QYB3_9FLAO|nr:FGGY family carbohydrate kinase [Maribacter ulvicola]SIQ21537.1 Sugar (pentulose or hexulose) kinase [Maribacter ulvicola]
MKEKVTAVFDIGKTNKKFFLFDKDFQEVYREYTRFDTTEDEDGYPTEDLEKLKKWLKKVFDSILNAKQYNITSINFSTYGASLVHLDENDEVLTPLYNYTKDIPQDIIDLFNEKYGSKLDFAVTTGSPVSGMLNSGLQLFWLKHTKPEIFKKIKYSLHLPQYVSYIFTGIAVSEYTSIGCHTALWNYAKKDYHDWVYKEEINKILPRIVSAETSINMNYNGKRIKLGVGIHDSSAALLPYIRSVKKKFILVSTGTWSIAMNPFSKGGLKDSDIKKKCINYMRINGKTVKASRLFLGNEYKEQIKRLSNHFQVPLDYHKTIRFDHDIYFTIVKNFEHMYKWVCISDEKMAKSTKIPYTTFEYAYHQLMVELVLMQVESIKTVSGKEKIKKLYIDGGFSDNEVFIQLMSHYLRNMTLSTTNSSLGSALGAALCISDTKLNAKFLRKNYTLKKHLPFIIQ